MENATTLCLRLKPPGQHRRNPKPNGFSMADPGPGLQFRVGLLRKRGVVELGCSCLGIMMPLLSLVRKLVNLLFLFALISVFLLEIHVLGC